jgi:hypothetical protein
VKIINQTVVPGIGGTDFLGNLSIHQTVDSIKRLTFVCVILSHVSKLARMGTTCFIGVTAFPVGVGKSFCGVLGLFARPPDRRFRIGVADALRLSARIVCRLWRRSAFSWRSSFKGILWSY